MDFWPLQIPLPVALATVAALGYLFGRRTRCSSNNLLFRSQRELRRARLVAVELEKITSSVHKHLSKHCASVSRFKERVEKLDMEHEETAWEELCREVEEILKPTLQLADQIAGAHEDIRQQSASLMTFTEVRTDPLTGVNNRRGLDDTLNAQFALAHRYDACFSLAMFDIDHFRKINNKEGHVAGDRMLQDLARLFDEGVREIDVVARYGGEEFVIVMPQTDLQGAGVFAERLRAEVERRMALTVSGGVAQALDGDTQDSVIARADNALYNAKAAGRNRVFCDDGAHTEQVVEGETVPTV